MKKKKADIEEVEEKIFYIIKIILGIILVVVGIAGLILPILPGIILIVAGSILLGNKGIKKLTLKFIRKIRKMFK